MTINWIPLHYYTYIYLWVMLGIVLVTVGYTYTAKLTEHHHVVFMNRMAVFSLVFVLLYMGLRPISGFYFGDMRTYAKYFFRAYNGENIIAIHDPLFTSYTYLCAQIMDVHTYFFVCDCLYVIPLWIATRRWFGKLHFYAFLLLIVSFSFWPYGTNGIRNGIATSLIILAISRKNWLWKGIWFLIAVNVHKSVALPMVAYLLVYFYTKPKYYLYFWFLCIPLSLLAGGAFQSLFASLLSGPRASLYLVQGNKFNAHFSSTGFRWDFLLYSATAVFAGWYYIFKKKYSDRFYDVLFSTYLLANGFWILVVKAVYSNRFAYLSWFLMALVIVYPLIKHRFMRKQYRTLSYVTLIYFAITFFLTFIFY